MASPSQLFREAQKLEWSLLQLYFETCETVGRTRYNSFTVADAVNRASERTARRRDKMLNDIRQESEGVPSEVARTIRLALRRERVFIETSDLDKDHEARELARIDDALVWLQQNKGNQNGT